MLQVNDLTKTFPNGTTALQGLSFTVETGEILALIGGSGCGKSTLLRLIAGLDPASGGGITVDGERIFAPHPKVGLVFQEPRLFPWLSVADNVAFGLEAPGSKASQSAAREALERVGLAGYADRWPRELSGGQSQRVSIARALITRPAVLLLDEPFSALDAFTREELQDHLLDLWTDHKPTLVLVTHDIEEAVVLASRVMVMRSRPGAIAADIGITLPRPRDRFSDEFERQRRYVHELLGKQHLTRNVVATPAPSGPAGFVPG